MISDQITTLLTAPSPAVLATYRRDGSALVSPVWFRWVEARGEPELIAGDVTAAREEIAGRYLDPEAGRRFAAERRSRPGVLLRLEDPDPRVWDLSSILPD